MILHTIENKQPLEGPPIDDVWHHNEEDGASTGAIAASGRVSFSMSLSRTDNLSPSNVSRQLEGNDHEEEPQLSSSHHRTDPRPNYSTISHDSKPTSANADPPAQSLKRQGLSRRQWMAVKKLANLPPPPIQPNNADQEESSSGESGPEPPESYKRLKHVGLEQANEDVKANRRRGMIIDHRKKGRNPHTSWNWRSSEAKALKTKVQSTKHKLRKLGRDIEKGTQDVGGAEAWKGGYGVPQPQVASTPVKAAEPTSSMAEIPQSSNALDETNVKTTCRKKRKRGTHRTTAKSNTEHHRIPRNSSTPLIKTDSPLQTAIEALNSGDEECYGPPSDLPLRISRVEEWLPSNEASKGDDFIVS